MSDRVCVKVGDGNFMTGVVTQKSHDDDAEAFDIVSFGHKDTQSAIRWLKRNFKAEDGTTGTIELLVCQISKRVELQPRVVFELVDADSGEAETDDGEEDEDETPPQAPVQEATPPVYRSPVSADKGPGASSKDAETPTEDSEEEDEEGKYCHADGSVPPFSPEKPTPPTSRPKFRMP